MTKIQTICMAAIFAIITTTLISTADAEPVSYMEQMKIIDKQLLANQERANEITKEINELQKSSGSNEIDTRLDQLETELNTVAEQIMELSSEFDRLETLNMQAHQIDPSVKESLYSAETTLLNKYVRSDQTENVDDLVTFVMSDIRDQSLIVMFDPEQATNPTKYDRTPSDVIRDMRNVVGNDIPIKTEYAKLQLISCTTRTSECDPMKGGIQVTPDQFSLSNGTLGFSAIDSSGHEGFVTAGHVAVDDDEIIDQPVGGRSVGVVEGICWTQYDDGQTCDWAFVDIDGDEDMADSIFYSSSYSWFITDRVDKTDQSETTTVRLSGMGSGNQIGEITDNNPSNNYNIAEIENTHGDSGAPIFYRPSSLQNYVDLYGIAFLNVGNYVLYHTYDNIKDDLSLQE